MTTTWHLPGAALRRLLWCKGRQERPNEKTLCAERTLELASGLSQHKSGPAHLPLDVKFFLSVTSSLANQVMRRRTRWQTFQIRRCKTLLISFFGVNLCFDMSCIDIVRTHFSEACFYDGVHKLRVVLLSPPTK